MKSPARRASVVYNWQVKLSRLILLCLCLVLSAYCKFKGTLQHRHHDRVWPARQPSAGRERPLATKAGAHGMWAFCSQQLSMRMLFLWSSSWFCPYLFIFSWSRDRDQRWGVRWPQALISVGQCSGKFGCSERFTEVAISLMLFWGQFHFRLQSLRSWHQGATSNCVFATKNFYSIKNTKQKAEIA